MLGCQVPLAWALQQCHYNLQICISGLTDTTQNVLISSSALTSLTNHLSAKIMDYMLASQLSYLLMSIHRRMKLAHSHRTSIGIQESHNQLITRRHFSASHRKLKHKHTIYALHLVTTYHAIQTCQTVSIKLIIEPNSLIYHRVVFFLSTQNPPLLSLTKTYSSSIQLLKKYNPIAHRNIDILDLDSKVIVPSSSPKFSGKQWTEVIPKAHTYL